jgi:hypothetical protein
VTRSESLNRASFRVSSITRAFDLPSGRIEWAWKGIRLWTECVVLRQKRAQKDHAEANGSVWQQKTRMRADDHGACGAFCGDDDDDDDDDGHGGKRNICGMMDQCPTSEFETNPSQRYS